MAIFGWVVLVLITLYALYACVGYTFFSLGFAGRLEFGIFILYAITAGLIYLDYITAPFTVTLK